jgi:hypothetical protein
MAGDEARPKRKKKQPEQRQQPDREAELRTAAIAGW